MKTLTSLFVLPAFFLLSATACSAPTGEEPTNTTESPLTVGQLFGVKSVAVTVSSTRDGFNFANAFKTKPGRAPNCRRQERIGLNCLATIDCDNTPEPPPQGATGSVAVTSGDTRFTLTPENGFFAFELTPPPAAPLIPPGATVRADSTASLTIPFSLTGKMPATIAVASPPVFDGNRDALPVTVDRTKPLRVAWTGGDAWVDIQIISGKVQIAADGTWDQMQSLTTVDCIVPARGHEATVPTSALRFFEAGDSVGFGYRRLGKPGTTALMNTLTVSSEGHKLSVATGENRAELTELVTVSSMEQTDLLNLK